MNDKYSAKATVSGPLNSAVKPHRSRGSVMQSTLLLPLCLSACSQPGDSPDIYLRCGGNIGLMTSSGIVNMTDQDIAAHISGNAISFSGNSHLLGRNVPICPIDRDGVPHDDAYYRFDSDSCVGSKVESRDRTHGTYYWVLGKLEMTNTSDGPPYLQNVGTFQCVRVDAQ